MTKRRQRVIWRPKLSKGAVARIRSSHKIAKDLAARYRVSPTTIWNVRHHRVYGSPPGGASRRMKALVGKRVSPRELQIWELIASGETRRTMAKVLRLTSRTIDTYRERLKIKLGIRGTAGLTRAWIERNDTLIKKGHRA